MPAFEVFSRRSAPVTTEPLITIQRRGTFSINRAAFEAMGEPEAVELMYDRGERLVGFRPADTATRHAYPVRRQKNAASYLVAGTAFCQYYKIPIGDSRRYTARVEDGVLILDLKQDAQPVSSNRQNRRPNEPRQLSAAD